MITDIISLHDQMKKLTLESGIDEKKYDSIVAEIDFYTQEELKSCYHWLKETFQTAYKGVADIKNLQPDHIWESYQIYGENSFREVRLLKAEQKKLRTRWNHPYRTEKQLARLKSKKAAVAHKKIEDDNS